MASSLSDYRMGTLDLVIVVAVIAISTAIGLYYAFKARKFETTRDFLVANSNIGIIPLILSATATLLSPLVLLTQPTEVYNNGMQVALISVGHFLGTLFAIFSVIPVYFRINVSTINEYIEYRFNRLLRTIPALLYLLQTILYMAGLAHLSALVFSDATTLSYWASMGIICGVCSFYSALGGFSAVIWTDVVQALIIFVSLGYLVIKGTIDMGGMSRIWNLSYQGNRTIIFRYSENNHTSYSFWSVMIGGFAMGLGTTLSSQTLLQRQMANKTLLKARITIFSTVSLFTFVSVFVSWFGLVLYARYHDCDPLLNEEVRSRDQLTAFFAKEIFTGIDGLFGLYIAGIMSAALSTMSSIVNAFSTVIIIDFVKPYFSNIKDKTATFASKILGILYVATVVATTLVISKMGAMLQLVYMIVGASAGPSAGMFVLGFFFPWANKIGAAAGYVCAISFCWFAAIGRFQHSSIITTHYSLPVSSEGCPAKAIIFNDTFFNGTDFPGLNITAIFTNTTEMEMTNTSFILNNLNDHTESTDHNQISEDVFPLYLITPMWYYPMAVLIVQIVGIIVSIITGIEDLDELDARLISPCTWGLLRLLPVKCRNWLGFKSRKFQGDMKWIKFGMQAVSLREIDTAISSLTESQEMTDFAKHPRA